MAKQKNIKIVYNVDTSQVKAAAQTVTQAKAATDQLRQSTKQLGDQSRASANQYKLSNRDMIGELEILKQKILDTATTDKARLNELIPKYRELKAQVDSLNKSMDSTAKASAGVGVSLGGVYNAVRIALTAGLIKETASAVIEMTALAGKIEGVKRAFDKLPNSILLMEELKQRTHGALTELELMQKALQARNFGIPIEQLGKLLEFAAIKSQQTGISIQYLTDSIVTGLGRESIKILDNLQIDIGKLKARMQETGLSMRQVVGDIVNEELQKMGGYLETGETKVNRLKSAWAEFGQETSKALEQSGVISFLTRMTETADAFVESRRRGVGMNQIFAETEGLKRAADDLNRFKDLNKEILADRKNNIQFVQEEINSADKLAASNKLNIMILKEGLKSGDMGFAERNAAKEQIQQREFSIIKTNQYIDVLKQYKNSLGITNEAEKSEVVTIESLNKQVENYNDLISATSIHDVKRITQLENLRDQTAAYRDALLNLNEASVNESGEPVFELTGELAQEKIDLNKLLEEDTKRTWKEINDAEQRGIKESHDNDVQDIKDKEAWAKERERIFKQLVMTAISSAHDILSAWNQASSQRTDTTLEDLDKERKALGNHYDDILARTGDNERARERFQIEREQKERELEKRREAAEIAADAREAAREKKERLRQIAIDTAAGIIRALTVSPGIGRGGGIAAGILAGEALIQTAIVNKFKDGVIDLKGDGTETSDSIPAMLSKRESVMTAAETKSSMGILKGIRARKLNDKIFEKLIVNSPASQPSDFSPVIKAIEKNRPADIIRQGSTIYEAKEYGKNLKRRIRRASF